MSCLKLIFLFAFLWALLCLVSLKPAKSISPSRDRNLAKMREMLAKSRLERQPPARHDQSQSKMARHRRHITTRPTTPSGGCFHFGHYYQDGEYIEKYPCYFLQCLNGELIIGDIFCENFGDCNMNRPPNDCCPACPKNFTTPGMLETTTTTTTTPSKSTTPDLGHCYYNGNYYENGEYVYKHPCYFMQCMHGSFVVGDMFCDDYKDCNTNSPPNDCCPACPKTTLFPNTNEVPLSAAAEQEPSAPWAADILGTPRAQEKYNEQR